MLVVWQQEPTMKEAYLDALAGDPTSAFGGVLIANGNIDVATAEEINKLFCEVVIAPIFRCKEAIDYFRRKEKPNHFSDK